MIPCDFRYTGTKTSLDGRTGLIGNVIEHFIVTTQFVSLHSSRTAEVAARPSLDIGSSS